METFSAVLAPCEGNPPVTGGFASERPMAQSFDLFFDLRLNKRLSKQSKILWFDTPSRSLWHICYDPKVVRALLCLVVISHGSILPIPFRFISLALWQSCTCPMPNKQPWKIWLNKSSRHRFNINVVFQVWGYHYEDKTVVRPYYLFNGNAIMVRCHPYSLAPPGQNGLHFGRRHFKCILLDKNDRIPIPISLKFVPRSLIDNKPALVKVMAWRRTGDKPLPEPMLTQFIDAFLWH